MAIRCASGLGWRRSWRVYSTGQIHTAERLRALHNCHAGSAVHDVLLGFPVPLRPEDPGGFLVDPPQLDRRDRLSRRCQHLPGRHPWRLIGASNLEGSFLPSHSCLVQRSMVVMLPFTSVLRKNMYAVSSRRMPIWLSWWRLKAVSMSTWARMPPQ